MRAQRTQTRIKNRMAMAICYSILLNFFVSIIWILLTHSRSLYMRPTTPFPHFVAVIFRSEFPFIIVLHANIQNVDNFCCCYFVFPQAY